MSDLSVDIFVYCISMNETISLTFRALRNRNYRLFFSGQCISVTGTWIQQVAINWLVYSLTKSALLMGLVMFAGSIPSLFLSPLAGVVVDRINKYHVLIMLQTLFMIEALILAILTLTGIIQVWQIVILSISIGITNAFDMPLRQAFVVHLIDRSEDLSNVISLNTSSLNLALLIGPAIAGTLIAAFGEGICFLINSLSYVAVIAALFAMRIKPLPIHETNDTNVFQEFHEGLKYVSNSFPLRNIIIYLAIASLVGMSYIVLMPIYAKEILHGNAQTLGFLLSTVGIGALFGALYLAGKQTILGLEKWICIASVILGLGLIGLSFADKFLIALILLFFIGFGMVVVIASCNTLVQDITDENKRGRVMSLYTMAFMGTTPIGSLFGGAIAHKIGVPHTFLLAGLIMIISAFVFSTKLKYFEIEGTE